LRRIGLAAAVALMAASWMLGGIAFADPTNAPGQNQELWIGFYQIVEETGSPASDDGVIKNLGGAISGGYFGNTSNAGVDSDAPDSGHGVTPSVSPGPLVGGCESEPGMSLGHLITDNGPDVVPANPDAGPSC
jgi:hypothetical protein